MTYGFNVHYSYTHLNQAFYSESAPLTFDNPSYHYFNHTLARALGLDETLATQKGLDFLLDTRGHGLNMPIAMAYSGHQYGNYTVLGDGRAHLLFEHRHNNDLFDIQLKGSGPTKYSRGFDGRLTLRSALLEYIISEALYHLNVPTSRSLAVIKTHDHVKRMTREDGALLIRVAKSHIRFGTFEYASNHPDKRLLKELIDYAIERHDKDLVHANNRYMTWFKRVIKRQAALIAKWQSIGFVHGVMNTDNALISGETIDYGPCAFIDSYDLTSVYSSIDAMGRYAYGQQPYIGSWNLATLGKGLLPLFNKDKDKPIERIQAALSEFGPIFETHYYTLMAQKIGIGQFKKSDIPLIDALLDIMARFKEDYTNTFINLTTQHYPKTPFYQSDDFKAWHKRWMDRLSCEQAPFERMQKHNPFIIPRNHILKNALDHAAYQDNYDAFNALLKHIRNPFNPSIPSSLQRPPSNDEIVTTYCGT